MLRHRHQGSRQVGVLSIGRADAWRLSWFQLQCACWQVFDVLLCKMSLFHSASYSCFTLWPNGRGHCRPIGDLYLYLLLVVWYNAICTRKACNAAEHQWYWHLWPRASRKAPLARRPPTFHICGTQMVHHRLRIRTYHDVYSLEFLK